MKEVSVKECSIRNAALSDFNVNVRLGQDAREAWEDATNMELGDYPDNLVAARHAIAPWHYARKVSS